jgi:hypothetical protein
MSPDILVKTGYLSDLPSEVCDKATQYVIRRIPEDAELLLSMLGLLDAGREEEVRRKYKSGFPCPKCGEPYTRWKNGVRVCRPCANVKYNEWKRRTGRITGAGTGSNNINSRKTCCPKCQGPYSKNKDGTRFCRPCAYIKQRLYRDRKKKALEANP